MDIISKLSSLLKLGDSGTGPVPHGWHSTLLSATKVAAQEGKFVLVKIHADWCGLCNKFDEDFDSMQHLKNYVDQQFICALVNEKTGEGKRLIKTHKIEGYPCFLVYSADGKFIEKLRGYQSAAAMIDSLKTTIKAQKNS